MQARSVTTAVQDRDGCSDEGLSQSLPRGRRRIAGKRLRAIEALKQQGLSNRIVAHRLGVTEKAIRKLVGSSKSDKAEQLSLAVEAGTEQPSKPVAPADKDIRPSESAPAKDPPARDRRK